jgi:hypothetical protein
MPIFSNAIPTKSCRAWEVIGGKHNMLVQRRTEEGLVSNQRLYHKLLYKTVDEAAYRIIYSEHPADFAKDALLVRPAADAAAQKPSFFGRRAPRRIVLAIAATREDILIDWDIVKQALAVLLDRGTKPLCPANQPEWTQVFQVAAGIVRKMDAESETGSTTYQSVARFTEVEAQVEDEADEGADEAAQPGANDAPAPLVVPTPMRRWLGVLRLVCTLGALVCTALVGLVVGCLVLRPAAVPAGASSAGLLVQAAQVDLGVFLMLFGITKTINN